MQKGWPVQTGSTLKKFGSLATRMGPNRQITETSKTCAEARKQAAAQEPDANNRGAAVCTLASACKEARVASRHHHECKQANKARTTTPRERGTRFWASALPGGGGEHASSKKEGCDVTPIGANVSVCRKQEQSPMCWLENDEADHHLTERAWGQASPTSDMRGGPIEDANQR